MMSVNEWLDDKYDEMATTPGFSSEFVDFEEQARILVSKAQTDGYTARDLADHCGGNVTAYIMNRVNTMNRAEDRRAVENAPYGG
ncbi:hypothetical protein GCM10010924_48060 [Rhizobium wenxiniae]|uniref:Uncharacterized protein n=1 Tax=Rhizobium wenxiniae TaxID=1737357 RepID=A0A7W9YAT5_9HYPH|nr:hypothetical protein [Rhizobium wenxiniae]MBB6165165.1 hypothetical protein [Rhizobium wenxiniae]GGG13279.1 hypothetical protein GCM10010924_48060 [Rhizobium wenxiniae]